jgi:hypothetical protein
MKKMISAKEAHDCAKTVNNLNELLAEKFDKVIRHAARRGEFNVKIYGRSCLAEIEYLENQGYKVLYDYDEKKQSDFLSINW